MFHSSGSSASESSASESSASESSVSESSAYESSAYESSASEASSMNLKNLFSAALSLLVIKLVAPPIFLELHQYIHLYIFVEMFSRSRSNWSVFLCMLI